jgi:hypothetical protein
VGALVVVVVLLMWVWFWWRWGMVLGRVWVWGGVVVYGGVREREEEEGEEVL